MRRAAWCAAMIALSACDGARTADAGPDAASDAGASDAGRDGGRPPARYCPPLRPATSPGTCPPIGADAGAASMEVELAIEVVRGRVLFDASDARLDGVGRLVMLVYDQDPYCETCDAPPVAVIDVDDAAIDAEAPYTVHVSVPRGPVWVFAGLDDDGDTTAGGPRLLDRHDLTTGVPQVALACGATTARITLDRRLGSLEGTISIDPSISPADLTGDVWLLLYPTGPITPTSIPVGATIIYGVDLSSPIEYAMESAVDYDGSSAALVPYPAALQLLGIFDGDADGTLGEAGELVAFAWPEGGTGVPMCLDDARLTLRQDVVFNYVTE